MALHETKRLELQLSEVRHRMANNLQLLASLTRMQMRGCHSEEAEQKLAWVLDRILTMSSLQSCLNNEHGGGLVAYLHEMAPYWRRLGHSQGVVVSFDIAPSVSPPAEISQSLALLTQEAVTNCLEHAFPDGRGGSMEVRLVALGTDRACVIIADDGVGMMRGATAREQTCGKGTSIIEALAESAGATVRWDQPEGGGTMIVVEFASPAQAEAIQGAEDEQRPGT